MAGVVMYPLNLYGPQPVPIQNRQAKIQVLDRTPSQTLDSDQFQLHSLCFWSGFPK